MKESMLPNASNANFDAASNIYKHSLEFDIGIYNLAVDLGKN